MTVTLEIETVLESYQVVEGLLERRERESDMDQTGAVRATDRLLAQLAGTGSYRALVDDDLADRIERRESQTEIVSAIPETDTAEGGD